MHNEQQNTPVAEIFTDGACRGNPGPGGWGVLMRTIAADGAKIEREFYGGERHTTNNRMELRAAIEGLQMLKLRHQVFISTDSKYVKDGFTRWLPNWQRSGWVTKARKSVKNKDLWQALYQAAIYHQVEWKWVKGHSGHPENERADALANRGIDECLLTERWVVVDTETTGMNGGGGDVAEGHKIIEVGAVELIDRQRTGKELQHYLNPDRVIDEQATKVHGYRLEDLRDKPRFAEIADELMDFIRGATLIAHNAPFDISFLNTELKSAGCPAIETLCDNKIIDSLVEARDKWPGQRNNLDALCKRYKIDNSNRDRHGALLDANLLADVYLAMTGGQRALFADEQLSAGTAKSPHEQQGVTTQEHQAAVVWANTEELAAHEELLDKLDKSGGTGCLWRQLDGTKA